MKGWVLITGPTSGIGRELAILFARDGYPLVLVARNESRLRELAEQLQSSHGVECRVISKDLSQPGAAQEVFARSADVPVRVLVNNAGLGYYGLFAELELHRQLEMMQVNMNALVELTHLFLRPMLSRREGRILNVASMAAFEPGPVVNVYYASKAFVYSFSRALNEELAGTGVSVTVLCPGTTQTEFFTRGGFGLRRAPFTMSAGAVAAAGYRALMRGREVSVPGIANKMAAFLVRFIPAGVAARIVRRIHQKR